MGLDGYAVIDLDGHVFEPDSLWDEYLDPEFKRRRPHLRIDERGTTRYEIDGRLIPPGTGRGAWAPEGIMEATTHRDGGIDPKARLADMDAEGIDQAVLYGAASLGFYALDDADYALALCRAYHDWLADYCSVDPDRLKGAAMLPVQSMPHALDEARRCVEELGFVSLTTPCCVGLRNPDSEENDPLYALAEDLDVPLGFHAADRASRTTGSSTTTRSCTRSSSRSTSCSASPTCSAAACSSGSRRCGSRCSKPARDGRRS